MKPVTLIAIAIFALIGLLQLLRVLFKWNITVSRKNYSTEISPLASMFASAVSIMMAIFLWLENS